MSTAAAKKKATKKKRNSTQPIKPAASPQATKQAKGNSKNTEHKPSKSPVKAKKKAVNKTKRTKKIKLTRCPTCSLEFAPVNTMSCPSCGQQLDAHDLVSPDEDADSLEELTHGAPVTVTLAGVQKPAWLLTNAMKKKRLLCLVGSVPVLERAQRRNVFRDKVKKRKGFTFSQAQFYHRMSQGEFLRPVVTSVAPLDKEQQTEADAFIKCSEFKYKWDLVVDTPFRFPLFKNDITTLREEVKLNDAIIEFYLMLLMAHNGNVYCFNSFFYKALNKDFEYNYDKVSQWGKRVQLFRKHLILIPVHRNDHWTLIVVVLGNPGTIAYCDSLLGDGTADAQAMKQYLTDEWHSQYGTEKPSPKFVILGTDMTSPTQTNGIDCGVFLCFFAFCHTFGLPVTTFNATHVNMFRRHIGLCAKHSHLANFMKYPEMSQRKMQPTRKSPRMTRTPVEKRTRAARSRTAVGEGAVGDRTRSKGVDLTSPNSQLKKRPKRMNTRQTAAEPFKTIVPSPTDEVKDSIQAAFRSRANGGMLTEDLKDTIQTEDGETYPGLIEIVRVVKMQGCDQLRRRLKNTPDVLFQQLTKHHARWIELFKALAFGGILGNTFQNRLQVNPKRNPNPNPNHNPKPKPLRCRRSTVQSRLQTTFISEEAI